MASWEARRGELEGKLAAPWARGGRGSGARGDSAGENGGQREAGLHCVCAAPWPACVCGVRVWPLGRRRACSAAPPKRPLVTLLLPPSVLFLSGGAYGGMLSALAASILGGGGLGGFGMAGDPLLGQVLVHGPAGIMAPPPPPQRRAPQVSTPACLLAFPPRGRPC